MLIAAAVCPHPPLLIPEAAGAADVIDAVRAACDAAVTGLLAAGPEVIVVVGSGAGTAAYDGATAGSLREFGIPYQAGEGNSVLPLSLTVGAWLLHRAGVNGPPGRPARGAARPCPARPPSCTAVRLQSVAATAPPAVCLRLGAELARHAPRMALLAMGDGPARRAIGVHGAPDPAVERYDAEVAAALADADPARLARIDPALDDELLVAGRAAWQVLAGAALGQQFRGRLHCSAAPYDVSYIVASWEPYPAARRRRKAARPCLHVLSSGHFASGDQLARVADHLHPDVMAPPVIAIVGPTAAGKSALSLRLAHALGGEVVNADSMQLYRGMDIGTAKLSPAQWAGVQHHLIDVWDVAETASVSEYQRLARDAISAIHARGRVPVLVGGSGLYVRAVLDNLRFPGTDPAVRGRLERELAQVGPATLHVRLARADPAAAAAILPGNGRRIVRALEVVELSGRPFSATLPAYESVYQAVQVGLSLPRAQLDDRISERVASMWQAGFVHEVRWLADAGLRRGRTASRALGYAQVLRFLAGEWSEEQAVAETVRATRRFARRQESWFRRDPRITWLAADSADLAARALATIGSCGSPRGTAPETTS